MKTEAELISAQSRGDHNTLWVAALPVIGAAVKRFCAQWKNAAQHRADLTQEATLVVGENLRTWRPERGSFTTWVNLYATKGLLRAWAEEVKHLAAQDAEAEEQPAEVGDPEKAYETQQASREVARVLQQMSASDAELLRAGYGIGKDKETLAQLSAANGVSTATTSRRMRECLRRARTIANKER